MIKNKNEITVQWIENILKDNFNIKDGMVETVEIKKEWEQLISQVLIISIKYKIDDENFPSTLFIKFSKPELSKQLFHIGKKEIEFYNNLSKSIDESVLVKCYYAACDEVTGCFTLVLEDLSETHFNTEWPLPPLKKHIEMQVDCIAGVHAGWWDKNDLSKKVGSITLEECKKRHESLKELTTNFFDYMDDRVTDNRKEIYKKHVKSFPKHYQRWLSNKNLTLVHWDAHYWNFFYPKDENGTVKVFDWQFWDVGVACTDLAYMFAMHLYPDLRKEIEMNLLERYYNNLINYGIKDYSFDDFINDYRWSIADLLVLPLLQWSQQLWSGVWWNNLERIMMAFEDWNCSELFE